jgi:hypothetical protein
MIPRSSSPSPNQYTDSNHLAQDFVTSHAVNQTRFRYSKSKYSQNTTNLLSIKMATCFDSRSLHQANY